VPGYVLEKEAFTFDGTTTCAKAVCVSAKKALKNTNIFMVEKI
jgi:hypothetical protein